MRYIFFTVLVILSACATSDQPENLIGKQKMVKVLTEIHLLEAKINKITIYPKDSAQQVYDHYEELLFSDLGISKSQYEVNFNYYLDHPDEFEKIYDVVIDSLLQREKTTNE